MAENIFPAVGFLLAGIAILVLAIILWCGVPRAVRGWMDPYHENWMSERTVLLGLPIAALFFFGVGGVGLPMAQPYLTVVSGVGLLALIIPAVYMMIPVFPIPSVLYPPWAREVRAHRSRWQAELDALSGRGARRRGGLM